MITPLDIENKKFSKRAINGYSTEEVDDFLDELTIAYEKIYKEVADSKNTIENLNAELTKYKSMEATLQNTLVMAQTTAEDVKNVAKQQAEVIITEAQASAKEELRKLDSEIKLKEKELDDLQKQFDIYKAKMESLLISQLELLKDSLKDSK
ncbi:MAG: DivIVA domain-containing protein [Clostridia bacterium]|nr:DivIVA domain-containing protein [Clostridia bacterium]